MIYLIPKNSNIPIEVPKELHDEITLVREWINERGIDEDINIPVDLEDYLVKSVIDYGRGVIFSSTDFDDYYNLLDAANYLIYEDMKHTFAKEILRFFDEINFKNINKEKKRLLYNDLIFPVIKVATVDQFIHLIEDEEDEFVLKRIDIYARKNFYNRIPEVDDTIFDFLFFIFPTGMLYIKNRSFTDLEEKERFLLELKEKYPELSLILKIFDGIFMDNFLETYEFSKFLIKTKYYGEIYPYDDEHIGDFYYLDFNFSNIFNAENIGYGIPNMINIFLFPGNYLPFTILLLEYPESREWINDFRFLLINLSEFPAENTEQFYKIPIKVEKDIMIAPVYILKGENVPIVGLNKDSIDQYFIYDENEVYMKIGDEFYFFRVYYKPSMLLASAADTMEYEDSMRDFGIMTAYMENDLLPNQLPIEIIVFGFSEFIAFENGDIYKSKYGDELLTIEEKGIKNYWYNKYGSLMNRGNGEYIYYIEEQIPDYEYDHGSWHPVESYYTLRKFKFYSPVEIKTVDNKAYGTIVLQFDEGLVLIDHINIFKESQLVYFFKNVEYTIDESKEILFPDGRHINRLSIDDALVSVQLNKGELFHRSELIILVH